MPPASAVSTSLELPLREVDLGQSSTSAIGVLKNNQPLTGVSGRGFPERSSHEAPGQYPIEFVLCPYSACGRTGYCERVGFHHFAGKRAERTRRLPWAAALQSGGQIVPREGGPNAD